MDSDLTEQPDGRKAATMRLVRMLSFTGGHVDQCMCLEQALECDDLPGDEELGRCLRLACEAERHVPLMMAPPVVASPFTSIRARVPGHGSSSTPTSRVYFISSSDGHVKIGRSFDPPARLTALQSATPSRLTLLAVVQGYRDEERGFHEKFHHLRVRGEWFRAEPELLEYIDALRTGSG